MELKGTNGRAIVKELDGRRYLISYWTIVCYVDKDGSFHRTWDGYSQTTVHNHVFKFIQRSISKREWEAMPVENLPEGLSRLDVMDYETRNRVIPQYMNNYYMGESYRKGWSYGF